MATKKRTPKETWEAIIRTAEEEEIARALAETTEEVDLGLRQAGMDPAAVRQKGEELGKRLLAQRKWRAEAEAGQAKEQAKVEAMKGRYASLPRGDLLARLAAAKANPRFSGRVAVMFRNHPPEKASEDELREMLEELDGLAGDEG